MSNEIMHHMDWLPTFLAAAGAEDIKERLKKGGVNSMGRSYKVHLDGYNFLPHLTGKEEKGPRHEIFYFADTGELPAQRIVRPVTPYDIAPTIATCLEIKPPSGSVGNPLVEVLKGK